MCTINLIVILGVIGCSLQPAYCSYLGQPRLHFAGRFRADTNTQNNDHCNFRTGSPINPDTNENWGFNGTNEFEFIENTITAVVYKNGTASTSDHVVGQSIIGNLKRPFAKLIDLDVDVQDHPTIYGLNFGVKWNESNDIAFYGKWTPNIIAQYMWPRIKCYCNDPHVDCVQYIDELYLGMSLGVLFTTKIVDIDWNIIGESYVLRQLREAADGGPLSVRISLFKYTRNYPAFLPLNATLGYVVGVIGVPSADDTLNVPGSRTMHPTENSVLGVQNDNPKDLCYKQVLSEYRPWMFNSPFEVGTNEKGKSELRLDLSNGLPLDFHFSLRDIGVLRLGVLLDNCVMLLGDEEGIPYLSDVDYPITSAIYTFQVDESLLDTVTSNPLVVGQMIEGDTGSNKICGESIMPTGDTHSLQVLLQEPTYFLRPKSFYAGRLQSSTDIFEQDIYVTRFGQPASGVSVKVSQLNVLGDLGPPLPENGIVPLAETVTTGNNGIATFQFKIGAKIPAQREYPKPPCSNAIDPNNSTVLPIDGQAYNFQYCVTAVGSNPVDCSYSDVTTALLAFSDVKFTRPYTWVKDVGPILTQYAHLNPLMNKILNLSSYEDVTKYHNFNLLNLTLRLDFEDPSYMPTTRDLSPTKLAMILEWLEDPIYDLSGDYPIPEEPQCVPPTTKSARSRSGKYYDPPRCQTDAVLKFDDSPKKVDNWYSDVLESCRSLNTILSHTNHIIKQRPLFGLAKRVKRLPGIVRLVESSSCTKQNLMKQLQTAIQVEWATIAPYSTALYSIVEGCNTEIYGIIREVIIQEMLHMTLAANILIALNGWPVIDDLSVTPSYPTRLPGNLLPDLVVKLEKFSLVHVHDIFMGIEAPQKTEVAGEIDNRDLCTIGVFYDEIRDCINELSFHEDIFDESTVKYQVKWPWDPNPEVGVIVPVTDAASAVQNIDLIISQGEGASLISPEDIYNKTLAHFFQFEEIVCQNHLEEIDGNYAYIGAPIEFNPSGVWPMRDNPTVSNVPPNTNCYSESRAFHTAYRNFLTKLHEVFNGHPDEIFVAVELMESLHAHAKKLMWTKFNPDSETDETTCGPVWDYEWPEK